MKNLLILLVFLSGMAVANPNGSSGYNNRSIVKCSSKNGQRKTCYADTSGGVRLINQLSRSSCQGNWGYSRNQIWVDHGCRAKFQLYVGNGGNTGGNSGGHNNSGYNNDVGHNNNSSYNNNSNYGNNNEHGNNSYGNTGDGYGNIVVCESHNSNRASCQIPRNSKVTLYRQRSKSSCEHNWGYNGNEIWVNNGCRAEFSVSQGGH